MTEFSGCYNTHIHFDGSILNVNIFVFFQTTGRTGLSAARSGQRCVYFYSSWRIRRKIKVEYKWTLTFLSFFCKISLIWQHVHGPAEDFRQTWGEMRCNPSWEKMEFIHKMQETPSQSRFKPLRTPFFNRSLKKKYRRRLHIY